MTPLGSAILHLHQVGPGLAPGMVKHARHNRDRGRSRDRSPPTPPDVLRSYPAVPSSGLPAGPVLSNRPVCDSSRSGQSSRLALRSASLLLRLLFGGQLRLRFRRLPRGAAGPGLTLRASPVLPSFHAALMSVDLPVADSSHSKVRPFVWHGGETSPAINRVARTTTASADFCSPIFRRCRSDQSLAGQTCRSPRVSCCVLGSVPAGFTHASYG